VSDLQRRINDLEAENADLTRERQAVLQRQREITAELDGLLPQRQAEILAAQPAGTTHDTIQGDA
jgi:hypothetical protein